MAEFKRTMNYLRLSLIAELTNPFLYVIFAFMFLFLWNTTSGVSDWLLINKDKLNIFELYIYFNNGLFTPSIYMIGVAFLSCGVFFFGPGAAYYLIRMNKKTWINGQVMYVSVTVFIYNLFLIIIFLVSSCGRVTFDGSWSNASFVADSGGALAVNISDIMLMHGSSGILKYNPNFVGILTFLLLNIEGITAGLLIVLFAMKKKAVYAVVIIFGGQFVDYLMYNELSPSSIFLNVWNHIMPFGMYNISNGSLNEGQISPEYAIVYTLTIMITMIHMLKRMTVNLDFVKEE